jgi:Ca-activated chloride channel family protein
MTKDDQLTGNIIGNILFDFDKIPTDVVSSERYMYVSLTAPKIKNENRIPLNLSACVDVSSSMSGEKIEKVKKSLIKMIQHLTDQDQLGIITFGSEAGQQLQVLKMTTENKEKAFKVVNDINAYGNTNLSGGLLKSVEQLSNRKSGAINRVLLFTDGEANYGIVGIPELSDLCKNRFDGLTLSCFGFGQTYNSELLNILSNENKGNFYHIDSVENIPESFANELGGLLSVFAQNVSVELLLPTEIKIKDQYFEFKINENVISIPDIYSEETRILLFKIEVEKFDKQSLDVSVNIVYEDITLNNQAKTNVTASLTKTSDPIDNNTVNKVVVEQVLLGMAGKVQKQNIIYVDSGRTDLAQTNVARAMDSIAMYASSVNLDMTNFSDITHDMADISDLNKARGIYASYSTGRSTSKSKKMFTSNVTTQNLVKDFNI